MIAKNLKHEVPVEGNGQTANVTAPDNTKTKGVEGKRKRRVDEEVEDVKDKTQRTTIQMISALPLKPRLPRIPKISRKNIAEDHLVNPLTPNFE